VFWRIEFTHAEVDNGDVFWPELFSYEKFFPRDEVVFSLTRDRPLSDTKDIYANIFSQTTMAGIISL